MARAVVQAGLAGRRIARDEPVERPRHRRFTAFAPDVGDHRAVRDMIEALAVQAAEQIALIRIAEIGLVARSLAHGGDGILGDAAGEPALCIVERGAAGMTCADLPNMADLSMANVAFTGTPVLTVAARGTAALAAWDAGLTAMKIAVAAQAVGGADKALEMARDYACTRQQFGQPIGAFQSIAHYLADAAVNVEGARMLTFRAASAADDGDPSATWADLAKLKACQVYRDVSALSIQIHGGIGFTLEADPQLYYRRAKHLQLMYGDPLDLQERAGEALISGAHRVLEA